jgi:predicted transcriptional regulator
MQDAENSAIHRVAADVVASYVLFNSVSPTDLAALIGNVRTAFEGLGDVAQVTPVELVPAVPIKNSITPDFLICLEDGKKFKTLKRHLKASFDLTPEAYRTKWNLPADYPMVAPGYSAVRSALAVSAGLGQSSRATQTNVKRKLAPPKADGQ